MDSVSFIGELPARQWLSRGHLYDALLNVISNVGNLAVEEIKVFVGEHHVGAPVIGVH